MVALGLPALAFASCLISQHTKATMRTLGGFKALRLALALPSMLRAPVECCHGRRAVIIADIFARRSSLQLVAMLCPFN
jgi:hypothetical protein